MVSGSCVMGSLSPTNLSDQSEAMANDPFFYRHPFLSICKLELFIWGKFRRKAVYQ